LKRLQRKESRRKTRRRWEKEEGSRLAWVSELALE
jgi:hypothetical protein